MRFLFKIIFLFSSFFFSFSGYSSSNTAENIKAELISPVKNIHADQNYRLGVFIALPEHWKMYGPGELDQLGFPTKIEFSKKINIKNLSISWPPEHTFSFQGTVAHGYLGNVLIPIDIELTESNKDIELEGEITYLVCDQICVPKKIL